MERGWPSGPRLPSTVPLVSAKGGCYHCTDDSNLMRDDGSRVRLFAVTLTWHDGRSLARVRMCDACLGDLAPKPDPLDVTDAA